MEESAEEDDEGEEVVFPYPVDTKVARDFGEHGIFWGVIEKHYPDDPNLCLVRFTDGDSEDLDRDEIQYAIELYEKGLLTKCKLKTKNMKEILNFLFCSP